MLNERSNPCRFDADMIVDRRRMRRKLTFWRVVAALVALVAVIGGAVLATSSGRGHRWRRFDRAVMIGDDPFDSDRVAALERSANRRRARSSFRSIHRAAPPPVPSSSTIRSRG